MRFPEGRILVTGAAGFIGSALIWALNAAGHQAILACDRLDSSERFRNLIPLRFEDYIEADQLLEQIERKGFQSFGPISVVFHLGACSSTTERDALYLLRNNYEYTKKLAQACLQAKIRFVYASSAATYGAREAVLSDETDLRTLRPLNMYAYSKQLFDVYAHDQGWLESCVGVKYFNVFGPNEAHKGGMRSVVAKAYEQLQRDNEVTLFRSYREDFADGEQCRDFVYVKDAVDATLYLAATPSAHGIFNIGSGRAATWNELAGHVFSALGQAPNIRYIEMPQELQAVYQYHTCASLARLRSVGYHVPMRPLAEAVSEYIGYLQSGHQLDPLEGASSTKSDLEAACA